MHKILKSLLLLALMLGAATVIGCEDPVTPDPEPDPEPEIPNEDTGVYGIKSADNSIDNYGGEVTVTFLSLGDWTVESDSEWCTIATTSGESGDGSITMTISPNGDDDLDRTATITINVDGYIAGTQLCTVYQSIDAYEEQVNGVSASIWVSDIMTEKYLWNDEFIKIKSKLNYYYAADSFLSSALSRMDGIDEDGSYYSTGERYYYSTLEVYAYSSSYVQSKANAVSTRAMTTRDGFGINMLYPVYATSSTYYLLVASVIDDSPADMAGITRGQYITQYNGSNIDGTNLEEAYYTLMDQMTTTSQLTLGISAYDFSGMNPVLTSQGSIRVSPSTYTYNPIVFKGVFQNSDQTKKVGYLVYSEFDMGGDDLLLSTFSDFKANGVDDLILDLRYNTGGDVYSSAVMATAIVGSSYTGGVYCEMDYNEYRKAKGEVDYFYIGEQPSMNDYDPIVSALSVSLDLPRVYVITTGFTASASELVINGLRGLGVEVILVGETTEGKNSGMEVTTSLEEQYSKYDFEEYAYVFAPITFYNLNAEGFKDFHSGFTTDQNIVETSYYMMPWGDTSDPCLSQALVHSFYGSFASAPQWRAPMASEMRVVDMKGLKPVAHGSKVYSDKIMQL